MPTLAPAPILSGNSMNQGVPIVTRPKSSESTRSGVARLSMSRGDRALRAFYLNTARFQRAEVRLESAFNEPRRTWCQIFNEPRALRSEQHPVRLALTRSFGALSTSRGVRPRATVVLWITFPKLVFLSTSRGVRPRATRWRLDPRVLFDSPFNEPRRSTSSNFLSFMSKLRADLLSTSRGAPPRATFCHL